MTNKEAKAVIFKWLKDRDFTRIKIPGNSGAFDYIHSLGEFNVLISFFKNRFDDNFFFQVGCYFDNCEYGYATIRVKDLKSNPHKVKYHRLSRWLDYALQAHGTGGATRT